MSADSPSKGIQDAGAQLLWNKKGLFRRGGLTWDAIKDENETLRVSMATKRKIWAPPKWEEIVDLAKYEGEEQHSMMALVTHLVKQVYDSVPTKPRGATDEHIQRYIDAVGLVRDACESFLNDKQSQMAVALALNAKLERISSGSFYSTDTFLDDDIPYSYIFNKAFPNQAKGISFSKDPEARALGIQVGNKALRAMQFSLRSASKAKKEISKGWPAKQELWQKQGLMVAEITGDTEADAVEQQGRAISLLRVALPNGRSCSVALPAQATMREALDQARQYRDEHVGSYILANFQRAHLSTHSSREEAVEAARIKARPRKSGRIKAGAGVSSESVELIRTGPEILAPGDDVTSEELMKTFGLRGVNFGNWVKQEERQFFLNNAYVSLMDLSSVMGLEPRDMGLGGTLGIAFGAQGSGSAAAHFVPGVNEINMTKTKGVGALAHEWAHAMDHYLGGVAGLARGQKAYASWLVDYLRMPGESNLSEASCSLLKTMTTTMRSRPETPEEKQEKQEKFLKHSSEAFAMMADKAGFDSMEMSDKAKDAWEKVKALDLGESANWLPEPPKRKPLATLPKNILILCQETGQSVFWSGRFSTAATSLKALKDGPGDSPVEVTVRTDYLTASISADKGKTSVKEAYWSSNHEMFARAFECWTKDALEEKEIRNDFLAICSPKNSESMNPAAPYPIGKTREAINAAISAVINDPGIREAIKKDSPEPFFRDAAKGAPTATDQSHEPERAQEEFRPVGGSQQDMFM